MPSRILGLFSFVLLSTVGITSLYSVADPEKTEQVTSSMGERPYDTFDQIGRAHV